ncbi:MAG: hypothetical protein HC802_14710 [Caldilineaceae bacterium]|nr:hypothetical protein [Caldilineaceae bacterium]
MATRNFESETRIYSFSPVGEEWVGFVDDAGMIWHRDRPAGALDGRPDGRVDEEGRLFKTTAHDERELGVVSASGRVHSHGLFEGGELGWVDDDGVVVQAGLILGEEEVGRVEGPQPHAAGAALLLLFLPDDAETNRRMRR